MIIQLLEGGVCRFTPGHRVAVIFLQAYMLPYKKLQTMKEMSLQSQYDHQKYPTLDHLSPSFSISLSIPSLYPFSLSLSVSHSLSLSRHQK